jgi:sugar (pentulose or hexulose) kinase
MGAALLAGWAIGVHSDLTAAADAWVHLGEPVAPDPARAGLYRLRTKRYADLLHRLNAWAEDRAGP